MKIGFLITARLKSSRLPFKLLMDLNGKSMVERVIDRTKKVVGLSDIILCTSNNRQDKSLVEIAKTNDIYYFLGSEIDVLQRLYDAASFFDLDYIINITGENPLFSIHEANRVVDSIKSKKSDFTFIDGLPIGCAVYGIKVKALKVVCEIKKEIDTEIWGPLINRSEIFNVDAIEVKDYFNRPKLRLTNDYFEDYQLMQAIFNNFPKGYNPSLYEALQILDQNPEYLKINAHREQAALANEIVQSIDTFYKENHKQILDLKKSVYNDN